MYFKLQLNFHFLCEILTWIYKCKQNYFPIQSNVGSSLSVKNVHWTRQVTFGILVSELGGVCCKNSQDNVWLIKTIGKLLNFTSQEIVQNIIWSEIRIAKLKCSWVLSLVILYTRRWSKWLTCEVSFKNDFSEIKTG